MQLPSVTLNQVDDMTLLAIDKRVNFIVGAKKNKQRHFLRDLASIVFYCVSHGYASTQSKKPIEKRFHELANKLLLEDEIEQTDISPEEDLGNLFG